MNSKYTLKNGSSLPKRAILLVVGLGLLAACRLSEVQPAATHTAQPAAKTSVPSLPAATSAPTTADSPASTAAPASNQEGLKDEWRPAFTGTILLFSSCELMYETHSRFKDGEIDASLAASQLEIEANVISLVTRNLFSWADPSPAVLPFKIRLEKYHDELVDAWNQLKSGDMADPSLTAPLSKTCGSFYALQDDVFKAMQAAGLTDNSIDEIGAETNEILSDLYNSIGG